MTKELQKLAFRLMELRERIEKITDWRERMIYSEGWANEYDKILLEVQKHSSDEQRKYLDNNYKPINSLHLLASIVAPKLEKIIQESKTQTSQRVLSESYKLLLDISSEFCSIQEKKLETLKQQAEAQRRKAVADFKEQGKRIEDIDKSREK